MQRRTLFILLGVLAIVFAVIVGTGFMLWRTAKSFVARYERHLVKPEEKTIDLSSLVTQVRELNRLETASMHVMHIGRVTQTYNMVPDSLGGDEITFLAAGDVVAGIDLSHLKQQDVWRSPDGTITVRLPAAEVLVTRVDNRESRVQQRKTGMFRRADVDLETRARQHAEDNIRAEALKKGILPLAQSGGEKKLSELLHTFGFEKVRFVSSVYPERSEGSPVRPSHNAD